MKKVFLFLFILVSAVLWGQSNKDAGAVSFYDVSGALVQRLTWKTVDKAEYYELTLEKSSGGSFVPESVVKTFEKFYDWTLPPGLYRYSVKAFDALNIAGNPSVFIEFEVLPAREPKITSISPDPYEINDDNEGENLNFTLIGTNFMPEFEYFLIKTMITNQKGDLIRDPKPKTINITNITSDPTGKKADFSISAVDGTPGLFELHIKTQAGFETVQHNILISRAPPPPPLPVAPPPPPIVINSLVPDSMQLPDIPSATNESVGENTVSAPISITFTVNGANFKDSAKVFLVQTLKMEGGALIKSERRQLDAASFKVEKGEKTAAAVFTASSFDEGVYDLFVQDTEIEGRDAIYHNISFFRYVKPNDLSKLPVITSISPAQLQLPSEKNLKNAGIANITFKITGKFLPQVANARLVQTMIQGEDGSLSSTDKPKTLETKNYKADKNGISGEIVFSSDKFDTGLFDLVIKSPWGDDFYYRNIRFSRPKEPPPDTKPVIASLKPDTITLPYENRPGKKPQDHSFKIQGKNISNEADVYLVKTMKKGSYGRYEHNPKTDKINALTLTQDKSGNQAEIVFTADKIDEGVYDFHLVNPNGEEFVYRNINIKRDPPPPNNDPNIALKPDDHFDLSVAIGYSPLIPLHGGNLNEYFAEPFFPMGAGMQLGIIPFQRGFLYFGFEAQLSWHYLMSDRGDSAITMPLVSANFNFLMQIWTFNKHFAINLRAGGGAALAYDLHVSHYTPDNYPVDDKKGSWLPSFSGGVSFRLRLPSPFFFELGAEYVIMLGPEPPYSSFIRPAFIVGIQG